MKINLKPIQFLNFKEEITITIDPDKTVFDLAESAYNFNPEIGRSLHFMFRGKKLISEKSLQEQGIKEGTKLMMYQSEKTNTLTSKEEIVNLNKDTAKNALYKMGFKPEMVDSVVNSIPNVDTLTQELIIEKSVVFLNNFKKETMTEYYLDIDESFKEIKIDEDKITSVFAMGDGIQGQLGIGKYIKSDFPMRVNKLRNHKIKSIACGVSHTTALTFDGQVFFWGRYYMPISTDSETNKTDYKTGDNPYPVKMESLSNEYIIEVGCGSNHSLAINDKGEIFSWGEGLYGQLGHGKLDNEYYPRKIETLQNLRFKSVTGGATHSIAVTHDDYVFGWGSNEKNQLYLKKTKTVLIPIILPLYEIIGNYTIDEIRNLNLDDNFKIKFSNNPGLSNLGNIKPKITSEIEEIAIENKVALDNQNEISYNVEDLMKVKFIDCGTWFSVCNSQMFPSVLYIIGNCYQKSIKITFFEQNKLDIKQISASNYNICVLTTDNSVYKINLNNLQALKTGEEAEKLDYLPEKIEIEKIGCGYSYLLLLTKNSQVIYNTNFEKNKFIFLNSEIRTNINDITTGPSHLFLTTSSNDNNFGDYLYEKIMYYINTSKQEDLHNDIFILGKEADIPPNGGNISSFVFPCHSFFIEQFIKIEKYKVGNYVKLDLSNENITILLELIYTSNLKILFKEESKAIIENPEMLQNLNTSLQEIITFLSLSHNISSSDSSKVLLELVNYYSEKINEISNYSRISKEYEKELINKKLFESCNYILNSILELNIKENVRELRRNVDDNNLNNDEVDPGFGVWDNRMRNRVNRNYFEQFENKGITVNIIAPSEEFNRDKINLTDFLNKQKELIDLRHQFYLKIFQTREKLNQMKLNNIRQNIKDELTLSVEVDIQNNQSNLSTKAYYKMNKLMLSFKSIYFANLSKIKKGNKLSNFNMNEVGVNFSSKSIESLLKFLSGESFFIYVTEVFEMLDMANYFMIDNLTSLLEIELEGIISMENVLCLLEASKDYTLAFLKKSCLFFIMLNFTEAKNKSIFKYIRDEDKTELRRLMAINNKTDKY